MGAPKFQRKKYSKPSHPWQKTRIDEERVLLKNYGLKNKKEIWKASSLLRKFKSQTKRLIRSDAEQARKEEKQFLEKLFKLNLLPKAAKLEDVLALTINDILDRRLQTQVFKQRLTRTVKQARQFIVHGHVLVNNKKVDIPSYITLSKDLISFLPVSPLSKEDHPERPKLELEVKPQLKLPEPSLKKNVHEEKVEEKKEEKKIEKPKETKKEKVPTAHELAAKKTTKKKETTPIADGLTKEEVKEVKK